MSKLAEISTLRVRDLMTPNVFTIAASTRLDDAARSLTFHRVTGAPVIEGSRLVGVISTTDLTNPKHRADATVRDAMTRVTHAVRPNDPALLAVRLMSEQRIHRVVVVGDSGRIAGIVSSMDVVDALARGESFEPQRPPIREHRHHSDPAVAVSYVDLQGLNVEA